MRPVRYDRRLCSERMPSPLPKDRLQTLQWVDINIWSAYLFFCGAQPFILYTHPFIASSAVFSASSNVICVKLVGMEWVLSVKRARGDNNHTGATRYCWNEAPPWSPHCLLSMRITSLYFWHPHSNHQLKRLSIPLHRFYRFLSLSPLSTLPSFQFAGLLLICVQRISME